MVTPRFLENRRIRKREIRKSISGEGEADIIPLCIKNYIETDVEVGINYRAVY